MDYVCDLWPSYRLGGGVKFKDGRFSTEDPGQIKIIESNDKYKVFIWPVLPAVEVKEDDKSGEGRLPAPQQDDREAAGTSTVEPGRGPEQGREACPVLQELETLVRGSGIIGGKGKGAQPKPSGKGKKG